MRIVGVLGIVALVVGLVACDSSCDSSSSSSSDDMKKKCEARIRSDGGYDPRNPVHRACVAEMAK